MIVIDFIDMSFASNRQKLFKAFDKKLRETDKLQSVVLRVSEFGLVQMTRKRSGKTLHDQLTETCATCRGSGSVYSVQTEAYNVLRGLQKLILSRQKKGEIMVTVHQAIFKYITTVEYNAILGLEKLCNCKIVLVAQDQPCDLDAFIIE